MKDKEWEWEGKEINVPASCTAFATALATQMASWADVLPVGLRGMVCIGEGRRGRRSMSCIGERQMRGRRSMSCVGERQKVGMGGEINVPASYAAFDTFLTTHMASWADLLPVGLHGIGDWFLFCFPA